MERQVRGQYTADYKVQAVSLAETLGLIFTTWLAAGLRIGTLPADTSRLAFVGAGLLCGIGDPRSFFIRVLRAGNLAVEGEKDARSQWLWRLQIDVQQCVSSSVDERRW